MTNTSKAFIDTSIFQGIVSFVDNEGVSYRFQRENKGNMWGAYTLEGDTYVFQTVCKSPVNSKPITLHKRFLKACNK